jgi:hypothetical protein
MMDSVILLLSVLVAYFLYYKYHHSNFLYNKIVSEYQNHKKIKGETLLTRACIRYFETFPKYSLEMSRRVLLFILTKSNMRINRYYEHIAKFPSCSFCHEMHIELDAWCIGDDLVHKKCGRRILEIFAAQRYLLLNEMCYNRDVTLRIIRLLLKQFFIKANMAYLAKSKIQLSSIS